MRGKRPKEQGEKDVRSPAKYKMSREPREDEKNRVVDDDDDDDVAGLSE